MSWTGEGRSAGAPVRILSFDPDSVDELHPGPDLRDQVRCGPASPSLLGHLQDLVAHHEALGAQAGSLGHPLPQLDGGEGQQGREEGNEPNCMTTARTAAMRPPTPAALGYSTRCTYRSSSVSLKKRQSSSVESSSGSARWPRRRGAPATASPTPPSWTFEGRSETRSGSGDESARRDNRPPVWMGSSRSRRPNARDRRGLIRRRCASIRRECESSLQLEGTGLKIDRDVRRQVGPTTSRS